MNYPPADCDYLVTYLSDGHEEDGERFHDEFALGEWVKEKERTGELDRECDGLLFRIYCVTKDVRVPIALQHPRLVRGRLEKPSAPRAR
ncbi:MAG TPA: hypothetical protein VFU43_15980 [Streptosporangiaceae bacterium]|nr:hypothetical protein [Streptosporangiaceae bacterium]